ncbi:MAG: Nramp family divalent metal transporter [Candidatus Micrarchaeota archaeon]
MFLRRLFHSPNSKLASFIPFIGPAFVASVAYMDPGNFATNIAGGSQFGYALLWVLLWSNVMAMVIQYLSAKLGIATGKTLPQNIRKEYSKPVTIFLWVIAELAAMATDLAEFLGAALGFYLLFGIPLFESALITGVMVFAILTVERYGFRKLEYTIMAFVGGIGIAYLIEVFLAKPNWGEIALHTAVPSISSSSIYVAVAMLGATVMPHVVYLHSALVLPRAREYKRQASAHLGFEKTDVLVAMNTAFLINAAMVVMAAAVFFSNGVPVASIEQAHQTLTPLLGSFAAVVFAIALLLSGLASSTVGTMAGQVIIEGFLDIKFSIFLRRLITLIPALAVIWFGLDPLQILILSQVSLSFALPFAIIPLIMLTDERKIMGKYANSNKTKALAWATAAIVVSLNILLLYQTFGGKF